MRVIAGSCRGRTLVAPPGRKTRPTSDRVRGAIFNALGSLGRVVDADVVDLWCGSGALGIEALSRGARHVTFVDDDRMAVDAVRRNVEACGLSGRAEVVLADVGRWLESTSAALDLALADPPYAFDRWPALFEQVPAGFLVAESNREVDVPTPGWELVRRRSYGTTVVTFARQAHPATLSPAAADPAPSASDSEGAPTHPSSKHPSPQEPQPT